VGVVTIAIVLAGRALSVGLFVLALRRTGRFERGSWAILVQGLTVGRLTRRFGDVRAH